MGKLILFSILCIESIAFSYTFPSLKIPQNWVKKKDPLPSIAASFDRSQGNSRVDVIFTDYAIPQIASKDEFKTYVQSLYPKQQDQFPRIEIREINQCKTKFTGCYSSIIKVTNRSNQKFVVLLHFSQGNARYLGMSDIGGHEDNFLNAQKISKEMQSAVSP